ncbi:MAG: glycine--tRNA ligase subunit beta, partial [Chloroflexi bacterium]|nr:glycine--tRNA ligase subunit beta [Chloroflexota bacterium]
EELPVDDLDAAIYALHKGLAEALNAARLSYATIKVMGTPRRLVAMVSHMAPRQRDEESLVRGPAVGLAYDEQGRPTRAALGFARSRGVSVEELQRRTIDGKDYVVAVIVEKGRPATEVLAEILPNVIAGLRFPQSMRWNASRVSFSRPIRWYVALLGEVVIPFEYAGVHSGRESRGPRPAGSPVLEIADAASYERAIENAGVMLDGLARREAILEQARLQAQGVGGELMDDPALLREVANLVEYPLAIRGSFDREFLRLPDIVLLAVMRKHQRYLPILRDGKLLPHFIAVANGRYLNVDAVRHGNEEVLRARYADAVYFYDADTKRSLEEFTSALDTLTFQERLGSMLDKVERLKKLVPDLGEMLGLSEEEIHTARRAAELCKSDLATQLVIEFTSLQGQMGRHYALLAGEPAPVAQAIEEHYLPRFAGDRLPSRVEGLVVGLADRLDTLVGLFAVGIQPSGAADPWGLRRAALGLVQLLVEKEVSLALPEALSLAAELLPIEVDEQVLRDVLAFITQRYRGYLLERGFRHDVVDAVLNERGFDPYLA